MILRPALAVAAALAFSTPAMAQQAEPPTAPQAPQRQPSPEEIAFAQTAQAFDGRMQSMVGEIQAMLADPATNGAQKRAALEGILAPYVVDINAFADAMQTFLTGAQARATDPQEQAAIAQALANGPANVRSIPDQVRAGVDQAIEQAAAQAGAAEAPSGQPAASGQGAVAGTLPVQ
ncbi:MAG: hypothetical protein J0L52_00460 [Caulobacterales bacterium]|nr:hypothetical protein [Caulobacterales bacterium]